MFLIFIFFRTGAILYFHFPASTSALFLSINKLWATSTNPVPISSHSILMKSAIGPNTNIPKGIILLAIIPITPKTLPKKSPSTFCCNKTVAGVLKTGITEPIKVMKAK